MNSQAVQWLAGSPWVMCVIAIIQVAIVAVVAGWIASRVVKVDAGRVHAVWFVAVCVTLAILPGHLLIGGWPVTLALQPTDSEITVTSTPTQLDSHSESEPNHEAPTLHQPPEAAPVEATWVPTAVPDATTINSSLTPQSPNLSAAVGSGVVEPFAGTRWPQAGTLVLFIYLIGASAVAIRLLVGMIRLRHTSASGQAIDQHRGETIREIACAIGLRRIPPIIRTDQTSMPLVFGLIRPIVLVPNDFESWNEDEIRATLFHELLHVRRRDVVGQLCASFNKIVYWFHPAVWYIDRRLAESREWATDREVVQATAESEGDSACGRYAESLLNIVSRLRALGKPGCSTEASAIAMAQRTDIEDRISLILKGAPTLSLARVARLRALVALLAVAALATTVKIEKSTAQDSRGKDENAGENDVTVSTVVEQDDNDLIARVLGSKPLTVEGDDFAIIVNVSGKVVSADGKPIAGAAVVLRESSGRRASSDLNRYMYKDNWSQTRIDDVIARAETDGDGAFRFTRVKAPSIPRDRSENWIGSIVAAHRDAGVGAVPLSIEKADNKPISDLELKLSPTHSISGTFVSPDGKRLGNSIVDVVHLVQPPKDRWDDSSRFELSMSQLTPRVVTEPSGAFEFHGLPAGTIAVVQASHNHWIDTFQAVRTSDDVGLGKLARRIPWILSGEVVQSPARIVADPGYTLYGKITDGSGQGIGDVNVYPSTSLYRGQTDSQGDFRLRVATQTVTRYLERKNSAMAFTIAPPKETKFLWTRLDLTEDQLTGKAPINVALLEGVEISGTMMNDDGKPMEGILIQSLDAPTPIGTASDAEGKFNLKLTAGDHFLTFATRERGYALPSYSEASRLTKDQAESLLHRKLTVSVSTPQDLGEIVVPRVSSYEIIVSLPDGSPAVGATAIIRDEIPADPNASSFPLRSPQPVDKSSTETTNSLGRVTLVPTGFTTEKAMVEVKYLDGETACDGKVSLTEATDGVISLVLNSSSIVEGRVLLDGNPVAGARVQVSLSNPVQHTLNGRTISFFESSGHQFVTTDSDGVYRAAVPAGQQCHVSLSSVPDLSVRPGIGYVGKPTSDGKIRVQDFELIRGDQEIAGRVVDTAGTPIAGARVDIRRDQQVEPSFWVEHDRDSERVTDVKGHFHLKKVPRGTYTLSVRAPRDEQTNASSRVSTLVTANTGDLDLKVTLDLPSSTVIPRLVPKKIVPVK